jgi:transcription antitermination factor NusG
MYLMNNSDEITKTGESWFALVVKGRHEKIIVQNLQDKGFEAFAPSSCRRKQGRNKVEDVNGPLFPGYVFSMFDPRFRLPILMTPGVRCVVGYGRVPVPIDLEEMNAIRKIANSQVPAEPCPYLTQGTPVRVATGPLANLRGVILGTRSSCRIVVSVSLIQQSIRIEVDRDMLLLDDEGQDGLIRFAS